MTEEIWKPIIDCDDYKISNLGNVKNIKTNKYLHPYLDNAGYQKISLCINKKTKSCRLHRLIAIHFIPNPENKPTIHHKNNVKHDNRIENLEWATMSEQNMSINKKPKVKYTNISCRSIHKLDYNTNNIIETYNSISDASKWIFDNKLTTITEFNKNNCSIISSKICAVANGHRNIAYGFKWKYMVEEDLENEIWKEIPLEYTNNKPNYFVSSFGRYKNNKGQILYNYKSITGYKRISIKRKVFLLHRLVAFTFIQNPYNKEQVNHMDGDKLNNSFSNLEWVTNQENQIHKVNTGLYKGFHKIIQYDSNMNIIQKFNSIVEASKELHISTSCISKNCRGKTKILKCGYQFRYDTN
jgi:hypothetical protein